MGDRNSTEYKQVHAKKNSPLFHSAETISARIDENALRSENYAYGKKYLHVVAVPPKRTFRSSWHLIFSLPCILHYSRLYFQNKHHFRSMIWQHTGSNAQEIMANSKSRRLQTNNLFLVGEIRENTPCNEAQIFLIIGNDEIKLRRWVVFIIVCSFIWLTCQRNDERCCTLYDCLLECISLEICHWHIDEGGKTCLFESPRRQTL